MITSRAYRGVAAAVLGVAALAASTVPAAAAPAQAQPEATATYIVTLESDVTDVVAEATTQLADEAAGVAPGRVYRSAMRGYTARLTAGQARDLAQDQNVVAVERDRVMHAFDTQTGAPWGLDRVD